jgi:hypothetical protein
MKSLLFKTGETTDSKIRTQTNPKDQGNAPIDTTPETEITRNRNRKYCFNCKIQNHTQEECQKRIKDNKPCKDKQGGAYWPKVYVTNKSQDRDQQGQQPVFH